ncbi:MAG: MMPL family transporter [Candidatus Hydrogenedentes bacterium]|nr:MMPL family transporter [Candidatus Hydrogenedentota bacterium]
MKFDPAGRLAASLAVGLLLLSAGALVFAARLQMDNRIERWLDGASPSAQNYAGFLQTFGSDEFVIAAYEGHDPFEPAALQQQLAALDALQTIPGVRQVFAIPSVYRDLFGGEDIEALRNEFSATPFYTGFIYQPRTGTVGFVIETGAGEESHARNRIVQAIRAALAPMEAAGWKLYYAGPPILNVELDQRSQQESARSFPIALTLSLLLLWALFRSLRALAVILICGACTLALTFGLMGATGYSVNMVTSVLPALLWVLSLAGIIHVLRHYQQLHASLPDARLALRDSFREVWRPCAIASMTNAVGFISLVTADMAPVRELGCFAAAGVLFALAVNLVLGPVLTRWFKVPPSRAVQLRHTFISACAALPLRAPRTVLALSVPITALTLFSLQWVRVESDPLTFLPQDAPLVRDFDVIAERLSGYYSVELVVQTPNGWLDQQVWPVLDQLAQAMAAQPGVARVLTPLDFLRKMNEWDHEIDPAWYRLPESSAAATQLHAAMDDTMRSPLARLVSEDGRAVRLSALINVMSSSQFIPVVDFARAQTAALPTGMTGYVTGLVPQLVEAQLGLVDAQVKSFGLAALVIFLCILVGLRSWRLMLVSIIPNVLPILVAFAAMAWWDIALDAATVMMASVALGIAVDDTVHLLASYAALRAGGSTVRDACQEALAQVGAPMIITSVTASAGFFALQFSQFMPIAWFGLLSGLAMLVASAAELTLVPALLTTLDKDHAP